MKLIRSSFLLLVLPMLAYGMDPGNSNSKGEPASTAIVEFGALNRAAQLLGETIQLPRLELLLYEQHCLPPKLCELEQAVKSPDCRIEPKLPRTTLVTVPQGMRPDLLLRHVKKFFKVKYEQTYPWDNSSNLPSATWTDKESGPGVFWASNFEEIGTRESKIQNQKAIKNLLEWINQAERNEGLHDDDSGVPLYLVATTSDPDRCPQELVQSFGTKMSIKPLASDNALVLLKTFCSYFSKHQPPISESCSSLLGAIAKKAQPFGFDGIIRLAKAAVIKTKGTRSLEENDFDQALLSVTEYFEAAQKRTAILSKGIKRSSSAPTLSKSGASTGSGNTFSLKSIAQETIPQAVKSMLAVINIVSKKQKTAFKVKVPNKILFYGPTGTGKTFLAKAIAGEVDASVFRKVDCGGLHSKWVGQTQERLQEIFDEVEKERTSGTFAVVVLDEVDAIGAKRSKNVGTSGGKGYNNLVNKLLTLFDDLPDKIIVVGTTNKPENLDPAVKRRFAHQEEMGFPNLKTRKSVHENRWKQEIQKG